MSFPSTLPDSQNRWFETLPENNPRADAVGKRVVDSTERSGLAPLFGRVNQKDLIYLTSQLAIMVDTGITLSSALDSLASQETKLSLKRLLLDWKGRIDSGDDFSTAVSRHAKTVSATFVALIMASEHSGRMGEMLEKISNYLRREHETRSKLKAAMAYPCVMLALSIGVTIFLLGWIMPKFQPLFERKGVKLPWMTQVAISTSEFVSARWPILLVAISVIVSLIVWALHTKRGCEFRDWVAIRLPIVGPIIRKACLSRSLETLATLVETGVPMLDTIRLTAQVAGNVYFERSWRRVLDNVIEGKTITETIQTDPLFPNALVQMISSGEQTAKLDAVLHKISKFYDQEVENVTKAATSMIEPALIICMGFVVGGIAMAMLLPIFSLSRPSM